jgi:hypothetical protein
MHAVVAEKPDAIVTELTRAHNGCVARLRGARASRASVQLSARLAPDGVRV